MAKREKIHFKCRSCGYVQLKWRGRCPECEAWNTLEEDEAGSSLKTMVSQEKFTNRIIDLIDVEIGQTARLSSGFKEVDQVLGGGIVTGSAMLLGGEPGIGKSTLLLQIAYHFRGQGATLYISGEESASQVKMRAVRLGVDHSMHIYAGSDLAGVLHAIKSLAPKLVIIDSVQTLYDVEIGLTPGTVNQVKRSVHEVVNYIKMHDIALFLVAHVTKDGSIAGPKVIEHLVDTVLYFESGEQDLRLLRAVKNRFGAVDELGIFQMTQVGLTEMSVQFYQQFPAKESVVGSIMVSILEGSRIFIHEIQSLITPAKGNFSRIYSEHIDPQRVARISAILEKYLNLTFSDYDIYMNVSGGVKLQEPTIDLAIALSLYSARLNILLPHTLVACGELSLSGSVRWASQLSKRFRVSEELGFTHFAGATLLALPLSHTLEEFSERQHSLRDLMRDIAMLGSQNTLNSTR